MLCEKMMTIPQSTRKGLFYCGLIIFIGATYFVHSQRIVAMLLFVLGITATVFAFKKLVCPQCGKITRELSAGLKHCGYCGTPYNQKADTDA